MKNILPILIFLIFCCSYKLLLSNQEHGLSNNYKMSIPKILSNKDKKTYLEINELQNVGRWDEVEKKIKSLDSKILLGYLEYDKLMHPNKYKASYSELSSWLETYTDFPVVMQKRV